MIGNKWYETFPTHLGQPLEKRPVYKDWAGAPPGGHLQPCWSRPGADLSGPPEEPGFWAEASTSWPGLTRPGSEDPTYAFWWTKAIYQLSAE